MKLGCLQRHQPRRTRQPPPPAPLLTCACGATSWGWLAAGLLASCAAGGPAGRGVRRRSAASGCFTAKRALGRCLHASRPLHPQHAPASEPRGAPAALQGASRSGGRWCRRSAGGPACALLSSMLSRFHRRLERGGGCERSCCGRGHLLCGPQNSRRAAAALIDAPRKGIGREVGAARAHARTKALGRRRHGRVVGSVRVGGPKPPGGVCSPYTQCIDAGRLAKLLLCW